MVIQTPVTAGALNLGFGGFISKFDPTGTQLIYSTALSLTGGVTSLVVDSSGNVHAVGNTETGFPTTPGAVQSSALNSSQSPVVFELTGDGDGFVYSTYLGGSSGKDSANSIALDSSDDSCVVGQTSSSDFPLKDLMQAAETGTEGFIAKLDSTGTLIHSTYFGAGSDDLTSIAVMVLAMPMPGRSSGRDSGSRATEAET